MTFRTVRLVLVATVLIATTSGTAQARTNCQIFFDQYLKAQGHKAFATTKGHDPGFHPTTCSAFFGLSSKKRAAQKAIADCNRHSRPEDGGHCRVIDVR